VTFKALIQARIRWLLYFSVTTHPGENPPRVCTTTGGAHCACFLKYPPACRRTSVKYLIIINYQSLNYAVKYGRVLSGGRYLQTFTNMTS